MFDLKNFLMEYDKSHTNNSTYNDRVNINNFISVILKREEPDNEIIEKTKKSIENIKDLINIDEINNLTNVEFIKLWMDNFLTY